MTGLDESFRYGSDFQRTQRKNPPISTTINDFSLHLPKMVKPVTRPVSPTLPTTSKISFPPRKIRKIATRPTTPKAQTPPSLTLTLPPQLDEALTHLRSTDPLLAQLISTHPPPTFFPPQPNPPPPFLSLTKSILYQQLATSAANSIFARFLTLCGGESNILPSTILTLDPARLREIGVSGRKSGYLKDLALKFQSGILSNEGLLEMEEEEEIVGGLTKVKGIGVWTVHMFLMFNLGWEDVLPVGDLGVRKGVMCLYGLKGLPKEEEMVKVCEKWKPFRSVGSWYMWKLVEANKDLGKVKASGFSGKKRKVVTKVESCEFVE